MPATNPAERVAVPNRLRLVVGIAGAVYLLWWFTVEVTLPGSFNPLPGRLVVVGADVALLAASFWSPAVARHLSGLFTAWVCLLVAHYTYLLVGNHGDPAWWVGAFVTFAAASMCLQSPREVAIFSAFSLACVTYGAAVEGQLTHGIYVPGLATILLLANITKRSRAAAQDATQQAARVRTELAAIVESSADAIVASSLEGVVRSWNRGAEKLFGYAADEAIGRPLSFLLPPGRQGEESAVLADLARGEPARAFEVPRRRKDGELVDVSIAISPVYDAQGGLAGASVVARDISDRKRAEAEAHAARDAAEAANRDLEAFNYSVAHDLRAPLRAIDGFSAALLEDHGGALAADARLHLDRVREAARHMTRLIDGLLALGRLSRADLRRAPVDLGELARAAIGRLREAQPDRVVEFVVEDGLARPGDRALLGAALENLLGNAWKFTRDRPDPRIEFGAAEQDGETVYFVRDNGAGFDMAYASKLFGVFQRLHPSSEFEGTGVGLATVKRIVQRHGGRIWGEGKVGEGACFHFTLGDGAPEDDAGP
ncbi:MAG TPA: PAS domain S-box protein [Polyangiaceae bacterium]|jgi:PAS domain S-box-containing protein